MPIGCPRTVHKMCPDSVSYTSLEQDLIDTGRADDEGNPIFQCPIRKGVLEDITQSAWTDTAMFACHHCQKFWEVVDDGTTESRTIGESLTKEDFELETRFLPPLFACADFPPYCSLLKFRTFCINVREQVPNGPRGVTWGKTIANPYATVPEWCPLE